MASRRKLKKQLKEETNSLIEDAFIETFNGDQKMDKVIDDLIDKRFELISAIANYPNKAKGAEIKKHFNEVKTSIQKTVEDYTKKIGHVK